MALKYHLISDGEEKNLTVIAPGETPLGVHSTNPNFAKIVTAVTAGDPTYEEVRELADPAKTAARYFEALTERISVEGGTLFFDGVAQDSSVAKQVLRFLDEDVEDWVPLVFFIEKVQTNPEEHSREQLYDWLRAHNLTITPSGNIIGYKGVYALAEEKKHEYRSGFSGYAIVDGVEQNGNIEQSVGSVVEMPRDQVTHDPSEACSTGLHVGTANYAKAYGSVLLKVEVNPRDVVSVPTDAGGDKVRVSRYKVIEDQAIEDTRAIAPEIKDEPSCCCYTDDPCGDCTCCKEEYEEDEALPTYYDEDYTEEELAEIDEKWDEYTATESNCDPTKCYCERCDCDCSDSDPCPCCREADAEDKPEPSPIVAAPLPGAENIGREVTNRKTGFLYEITAVRDDEDEPTYVLVDRAGVPRSVKVSGLTKSYTWND